MTSPSLRELARALGGEVAGGQVLAPGPGHDAKDRSLSVKPAVDAPGFVVHSFAGDDPITCKDHVRSRLGLPAFKPNGHGKEERKLINTRTYTYDNLRGDKSYCKERYEYSDGSKSFAIKPKGRGGSAPLLYGGERLADVGAGQAVWIIEGENKVDRLRDLGQVGVCGDTGAQSKWLPEHAELLRGLPIVLWPDSDEPGERYIANAATAILAEDKDADIRVVRPFGRPNGAKGRDVCDWSGDADAIAQLVANALPYKPFDASAPREPFTTKQAPEIITRRASEIKPEPIAWLWKYWIARGKLHIIGGVPETGKTTIALAYAATVSSGGTWPDGTRAMIGNILVWTSEDDPADTLVPRLMRMGVDLDRIHFIEEAIPPGAKSRPFNPASDMPALVEKAKTIGDVALVILDPVVAAMRIIRNSHNNATPRNGMQPVVDFAKAAARAWVGRMTERGKPDVLCMIEGGQAYPRFPESAGGSSVCGAVSKGVLSRWAPPWTAWRLCVGRIPPE